MRLFWLLLNSAVTAAKKVLISVLRHPLSECQMGLPGAAGPLGLTGRIDVQHNGRHLGPIRALCVGIEEAEICLEMLFVVTGQDVGVRSSIGYRRRGWRLWHKTSLHLDKLIIPYQGTYALGTIAAQIVLRQRPDGCARPHVRP